jgi:hypothetical protein
MYNHFIPNFLTKFLSKCTILTPHSRIRDKQAEIKLIQDKLVAPTQEIKDLEHQRLTLLLWMSPAQHVLSMSVV